jgi:hypothetical protein
MQQRLELFVATVDRMAEVGMMAALAAGGCHLTTNVTGSRVRVHDARWSCEHQICKATAACCHCLGHDVNLAI